MALREGEHILLLVGGKNLYLIELQAGKKFHTNKGMIELSQVMGMNYGDSGVTHTGVQFVILEPTTEDFIMNLRRKTQIIYPKDVGIMLIKTGLSPGMQVLEVGTGSGALTIVLSKIVGTEGRVISYDLREDYLENAVKNLKKAGAIKNYELRLKKSGEPFRERDIDIVFLDLPEPWNEIPAVKPCLKGGGRLTSISPTYNQVEKTGIALEENGFVMIETVEILLRRILPRQGRTRPHQLMIGHTAFLTFARKANQL